MPARPTACAKAIAVAQAFRVGGSYEFGVRVGIGCERVSRRVVNF